VRDPQHRRGRAAVRPRGRDDAPAGPDRLHPGHRPAAAPRRGRGGNAALHRVHAGSAPAAAGAGAGMRTELQQGAAERQWAEQRRETPAARLGPWLRQTAAMVLPAALGLGLLFAAWEAWVRIKDVKPYLLPAPSAVFERLYEDPWLFIEEGLATLQAALLGFGAGAGIALALA